MENHEILSGDAGHARFSHLAPSDNDPMRHVFSHNNSIYRGVEQKQILAVRRFFESGMATELIEAGLLTPSNLVEGALPGYDLAVEQPELTAPTAISEMPPSMRRDVSIALIHIARTLDSKGLCLRDFDASGFVIDQAGQPRFHNISAIRPKGSTKFGYAEFHANYTGPLRLIDQRPELAALVMRTGTISTDEDLSLHRPLLRGAMRWISQRGPLGKRAFHIYRRLFIMSPFGGLLHNHMYITFVRAIFQELLNNSDKENQEYSSWQYSLFSKMEKVLLSMNFDKISQKWSDYHGSFQLIEAINAGERWDKYYDGDREKQIIRLLTEARGKTLLDVGANIGHFSILGTKLGYQTTAVDNDIGAIERLYNIVRNAEKPVSLRPFVLDFVGLDSGHLRRFRSDAVLALGFVHHMRLVEFLPWSIIAEKLSALTGQILITEFKPGTGASSSNSSMTATVSDDYCLENFINALEPLFQSVEVIKDHTAMNSASPRTMLVCRR
ncbi:MAG: hypothetical protein NXI27_15550 [Alphaproteobacteria bacterium]|nr:hypothetical protein [Alphaproteobacteria bacterium]